MHVKSGRMTKKACTYSLVPVCEWEGDTSLLLLWKSICRHEAGPDQALAGFFCDRQADWKFTWKDKLLET